MPSAAAPTPTHTVPGIEHCLAGRGVSLVRFLGRAGIARSTWSRWYAGGAKRADKWADAIAAYEALIAEAAPAPAAAEPAPTDPVPLLGSSAPIGAPPSFVPIATASCPDPASAPRGVELLPHPLGLAPNAPEAACRWEETSGAAPAADRQDDVAAEAVRVAALARREWAALALTMRTDERRAARPSSRTEIARRAADRLCGRMNRRLKAGCRALARQPATTSAALAAKARAVLAVENATDSDGWWVALRDAVVRDAAALPPTSAGAAQGAEPGRQDGPLSIEQAAAMDCKPFDLDGWLPPSAAEWVELGSSVLVTLRIAYRLLLKDKAGTVALMAGLADAAAPEMNDQALFERIDGALAFFEIFTTVLSQARLRYLCAAAAVALQREARMAAEAARSAA